MDSYSIRGRPVITRQSWCPDRRSCHAETGLTDTEMGRDVGVCVFTGVDIRADVCADLNTECVTL